MDNPTRHNSTTPIPSKNSILTTVSKAAAGLWLWLWCAATCAAQSPPDYFSAPNLLRFADHLYQRGDYARAAGEYSRFLIAYPDSPRVVAASRLIQCYEKNRQFDLALQAAEFAPDSLWRVDCGWHQRRARLYFQASRFDSLTLWAAKHPPNCPADTLCVLLGATRLLQRDWPAARLEFEQLSPDFSPRRDFLNLTIAAVNRPHKSPALAALLSVAAPGAGKLYLGRKGDALLSFLTTGLLAWQTASTLDRDGADHAGTWVYGGLTVFFWGGTIYGSFVGAKVINQTGEEEMDARIRWQMAHFLD